MPRVTPALLAVLACAALPACGAEDEDAEPAAPVVDRKPETRQALPDLPPGFEPYRSPAHGLAFGRPPGWKATRRGPATLLIAPDELVVMSVSADRTDEAVSSDTSRLAVDTFMALEGYKGKLKASKPRKFAHRYPGYQVRGDARAKRTGVPQRLRVIVLEREGRTVVTAVMAENSKEKAPDEVKQAYQALRSLRTGPVDEKSDERRKPRNKPGPPGKGLSQRSGRSG